MFISDFAIRRPIITVVTMIALVVFGLASLARLDTDEFPDDRRSRSCSSPSPIPARRRTSSSAKSISRIEDKISGISGVDKINSTSTDGFAQIIVQFVFSKAVDQATQDIRDAISAVRAQLPAEILEPIIQRFDPNDAADRLAGAHVDRALAAAADAARRSDDRPASCARSAAWRR